MATGGCGPSFSS